MAEHHEAAREGLPQGRERLVHQERRPDCQKEMTGPKMPGP